MNLRFSYVILSLTASVSLAGCVVDGSTGLDGAEEQVGDVAGALCVDPPEAHASLSIFKVRSVSSDSPTPSDPSYAPQDWAVRVSDFDMPARYATAEWADLEADGEIDCIRSHMDIEIYGRSVEKDCWTLVDADTHFGEWIATSSGWSCVRTWQMPLDEEGDVVVITGQAYSDITSPVSRRIRLGAAQEE